MTYVRTIRQVGAAVVALTAASVPAVAFAQGEGFTFKRVVDIAYGLVQWLFSAGFVIALILGVWFGIQMMLAGTNAEKFKDARTGLTWTIIGFAVVMVANVIVLSLRRAITGGP